MALSLVGAGGTVVAQFDPIAMHPTVSIGVKSDFGVRGLDTSRGLWHG
jgi:hypothetical protein